MKDRLTKKRIRVDYKAMIYMLGLYHDFVKYVFDNPSIISRRRKELNFLRSKKVDIEFCHHLMVNDHILSYDQLILYAGGNFQIIQDCCYEL